MGSRGDVVSHHERLVTAIASRLLNELPFGVTTKEELEQVGRHALIEAAEEYSRDGAALPAHIWMRIRGAMLDWLGTKKRKLAA